MADFPTPPTPITIILSDDMAEQYVSDRDNWQAHDSKVESKIVAAKMYSKTLLNDAEDLNPYTVISKRRTLY